MAAGGKELRRFSVYRRLMAENSQAVASDKEEAYDRAHGTENRVGYGESPAIVVVDLQNGETDPEHRMGSDLSQVIENTNELAAVAHEHDVPIVWVRTYYTHPDAKDAGVWQKKVPGLKTWIEGSKWVELDERLNVAEDDYVLQKRHASCFHDTELGSLFTAWGIDTVVLTGCSTGGCIRSTAIDANAMGYRPIVPDGCVNERSKELHNVNLFEIDTRFGDVQPMDEVEEYLASPGDYAGPL